MPGCISARRSAPAPFVIAALIALAGWVAPPAMAGSLAVTTQPGRSLASRVTVEPWPEVVVRLWGFARGREPEFRAGVTSPVLIAGPLLLAGLYADLASSGAAATISDRHWSPGRIAVDGGLMPTARNGAVFIAIPGIEAFIWTARDVATVGALVRADRRVSGVRVFAEGLGAMSRVRETGIDDPLDRSWSSDLAHDRVVSHALAKLAFISPSVRFAAMAAASLPERTMPGVFSQVSLQARPLVQLRLNASAKLATPDYRDARGRRPSDAAGYGLAVRYDGAVLGAAVEYEQACTRPDLVYPGVIPAFESLEQSVSRYSGRLSVRPAPGRWLPLAGADAAFEPGNGGWRVRLHARVTPLPLLELQPSLAFSSQRNGEYRIRTTVLCDGPSLERIGPDSQLGATVTVSGTIAPVFGSVDPRWSPDIAVEVSLRVGR